MKKLLLPLWSILLVTACQKIVPDVIAPEEINSVTAKAPPSKIDVCHLDLVTNTWHTINISINAWPAHQAHGDVRLDDQDGDGYVPNNECGFGQMGDCDDNNAALNPATVWYKDSDNDGYSNGTTLTQCAQPAGYKLAANLTATSGDCNDDNAAINPGAAEICGNSIDDNCNGQTDEGCTVIAIGQPYQGGIIAYILQPDDPGYDANVPHGLIAADFTGTAQWGCDHLEIPGADGTALGTGNQNTMEIMAGCAEAGIAARICGDLVLNGYDDWYLPSKDELNKLYMNRLAIGGFNFGPYWSSTEWDINPADNAWYQLFPTGLQNRQPKNLPFYFRAVRAF